MYSNETYTEEMDFNATFVQKKDYNTTGFQTRDVNLTEIQTTGNNDTEFPCISNLSNCDVFSYLMDSQVPDDGYEDYDLPDHVRSVLLCLYVLTILLAVGGNSLVIYVVFTLQRMRNITNFYIVNLSVSDIIVSALCIPFTLLSNLIYYYWPFGSVLCPSIMFLQLTAVLQRAHTLVAMTLDRHYAIWKPLNRKFTKSEAKCTIAVIWITSALISLPTAIHTKIIYLPYEPGSRGLCTEVWDSAEDRYWYSISIMILQYFIPLAIMCVTYIHIGIIIWVKRPPGEADSNRDVRLAASKRKTVKMLLVVVFIYALCWLPLHAITIAGDLDPHIYDMKHVHVMWLFSHWLAVTNTFSNPVIYFWMNAAFHQGFLLVIRKLLHMEYRFPFRRRPTNTSSRALVSRKSSSQSNNAGKGMTEMARYD